MSKIFLLFIFLLLTGCSSWSPPEEYEHKKEIRSKWESPDCDPKPFGGRMISSQDPKCVSSEGVGYIPTDLKYLDFDGLGYVSDVERFEGDPDFLLFDVWKLWSELAPGSDIERNYWEVTRKGKLGSYKILCQPNKTEVYMMSSDRGYILLNSSHDFGVHMERDPDFYQRLLDDYKHNEIVGKWMCSNY